MFKFKHVFFPAIALCTLLLAGCQSSGAPAPYRAGDVASKAPQQISTPLKPAQSTASQKTFAPKSPVNVALLLPLSGASSAVGQSLLDAATLAMFDTGGNAIKLNPIDSGDTPKGAENALRQALAEKNTVVLGPLFGAQVRAIAPAARAANVPIISFSNDDTVAGEGVYTLGLMPDDQVTQVMRYAQRQGINAFGILAPNTPYGKKAVQAAQSNGTATIVAVEYYNESQISLEAAVQRLAIKAATTPLSAGSATAGNTFQALIIPAGGSQLKTIASLLESNSVVPANVRFLGTSLWQNAPALQNPFLMGSVIAAPSLKNKQAFEQKYRATFENPPLAVGSLAYDATALAALLASTEQGVTPESLSNPNGFTGVDGIFRFTPNGTAERGLAVFILQSGQLVEVQGAPRTFNGLVN
jgi:ABC-type branched-subunit amino acid transport system substrate-binding protein